MKKDNIQIYYFNLKKIKVNKSTLTSILSKKEVDRANKFKFEKDRNKFIISRGILRELISKINNIDPKKIKYNINIYGKPFISNENGYRLKFNLSHSGELVIYAFSHESEIGIDIEILDSSINHLELAKNYFTNNEINYLSESQNSQKLSENFFRVWTRKEALLKAVGTGLFSDLKKIETLNDIIKLKDLPSEVRINFSSNWNITDLEINTNYKTAIAYGGNHKNFYIEQINPSN